VAANENVVPASALREAHQRIRELERSGQEADGDRDRLAEGFVHTFKRDCVSVHELRDAESVLAQLGDRIEDYNIRER